VPPAPTPTRLNSADEYALRPVLDGTPTTDRVRWTNWRSDDASRRESPRCRVTEYQSHCTTVRGADVARRALRQSFLQRDNGPGRPQGETISHPTIDPRPSMDSITRHQPYGATALPRRTSQFHRLGTSHTVPDRRQPARPMPCDASRTGLACPCLSSSLSCHDSGSCAVCLEVEGRPHVTTRARARPGQPLRRAKSWLTSSHSRKVERS